MKKITIVGVGRVGESTAQILAQDELCQELVLLGRRDGVPQGVALDIHESSPLFRFDVKVTGAIDPAAMAGSDLVIITAGLPRKPGMSRSDVLDANLQVLTSVVDDVLRYAPDSSLLIVSNPVDVLTYHAWKQTGWDRSRVFGLSGVLDSARMAGFIALETNFSTKDITAMVLGGHGDSMVPLPDYTCIRGIPISQFMDQDTIDRIVKRTRQGGAEILALKQNSSAYNAPAASVASMVDAISHRRRRILPCVVPLEGEYGLSDIAMGVPVVLGKGGVEQVVELKLSSSEMALFQASSEQIRADLAKGDEHV